MYRLLTVLAFVATTSGCASIGAEDYGCSGIPDGVTCMSTRDVFDSSNSGSTPVRVVKSDENYDRDSRDSNDDEEASSEKNNSQEVNSERVSDPVVDTFVTPRIPDKPIPIRTPAQVMRIWGEGSYREALSLLYRASLSRLIDRYELAFRASHTEAECAALVRACGIDSLSDYFWQLTNVWRRLAYGHHRPESEIVQRLCDGWTTELSDATE